MFHFDGRSVEQLAAGLGARFLPAWVAGQLRQPLSFNLDQERVTELDTTRHGQAPGHACRYGDLFF